MANAFDNLKAKGSMRTMTFSRSAEQTWSGDVARGSGQVKAKSGAFEIAAGFSTIRGEAPGITTPEELLAASQAVCYGIGLRSVIGRQGGSASRAVTAATITAEKGPGGIRIRRSHPYALAAGLAGIERGRLTGNRGHREKGVHDL